MTIKIKSMLISIGIGLLVILGLGFGLFLSRKKSGMVWEAKELVYKFKMEPDDGTVLDLQKKDFIELPVMPHVWKKIWDSLETFIHAYSPKNLEFARKLEFPDGTLVTNREDFEQKITEAETDQYGNVFVVCYVRKKKHQSL